MKLNASAKIAALLLDYWLSVCAGVCECVRVCAGVLVRRAEQCANCKLIC